MEGALQVKSYPEFSVTSPPSLFVSSENIFLYLLPDGSVHGYDSKTAENFELPGPERSVNSRVTCITISPAQTLAAAGFENGSVQVYDLGDRKTLTSAAKARKGRITQVAFVGDFDIVAFDEMLNLTMFTLARNLFGAWTLKHTVLTEFRSFASCLATPLVYGPVDGLPVKPTNEAVCRSQRFANYVGIAMFNRVVVAEVKPAWKIVVDRPVDKPVLAFDCPDPEVLYVACGSAEELRVDRISNGKVQEVFKKSLRGKEGPVAIGFLSGAFVVSAAKNGDAVLYNFAEGTEVAVKLEANGLYTFGNNCVNILTAKSLQTFFLTTFFDQIASFKHTSDVEGAVALCKRVIEGDSKATVGLPMNIAQRALVIENALSPLLTKSTAEKLKAKEDPAKIAAYLIQLSLDLHIEEWVGRNALRLFKEADVVGVFIEHIVKADPKAQSFTYSSQFVDLALEFCQDLDMSEFLYALPSKIVSPTVLLQYMLKVHNSKMAAMVYQERLNDPLSAMSVFYAIGEYEQAFQVLQENLSEKSIAWLFAMKGNTFPRLENLVQKDPELALDVLTRISKGKKPFSNEVFVNALLSTLAGAFVPANNPLYKFVEEIILRSEKLKISKPALHYLMSSTFTDVVADPDNRESVVIWILNQPQTSNKFKQSLLPLCDAYCFKQAKQQIRDELKLYALMLQDVINEGAMDPFDWIESHMNSESKDDIETVIKANADRLLSMNLDRLVTIMEGNYPSLITQLVHHIRNPVMKNYYIYHMLVQQKHSGFESHLIEVGPFIATHFPDALLPLLEQYATKETISLLPICEEKGLVECCAVLCERAADYDNLLKFIKLLILHRCEPNLQRISQFTKTAMACKPESTTKTFHRLAKCYLLPLTQGSNVPVLCESLRTLIDHAMEGISYEEILAYCGKIFNPLGRDKYEQILNQLLKGQELTPEQTRSVFASLVQDLKNGESDLAKLICAQCKLRLFVDDTGVVILKCGHAVHATAFCKKALPHCPLCQSQP